MKVKISTKESRKHLSQSVYSLKINYKTGSRSHKHILMFSITEDINLLAEVHRLLAYSSSHLIQTYSWLKDMRLISFEVSIMPLCSYSIAPAISSYCGILREQISVTPYDVCVADFHFTGNEYVDSEFIPL